MYQPPSAWRDAWLPDVGGCRRRDIARRGRQVRLDREARRLHHGTQCRGVVGAVQYPLSRPQADEGGGVITFPPLDGGDITEGPQGVGAAFLSLDSIPCGVGDLGFLVSDAIR